MCDVAISTPKGARDILRQLRTTFKVNRTARLLFSKVEKAFNFKDYTIASQAKEIAELRARLEEAKPKRRKKVHLNPNTIFAGIKDIVRAKK